MPLVSCVAFVEGLLSDPLFLLMIHGVHVFHKALTKFTGVDSLRLEHVTSTMPQANSAIFINLLVAADSAIFDAILTACIASLLLHYELLETAVF